MSLENESHEIDAVAERVAARFPEADPGEIRAEVEAELTHFAESHVRDFVPVLVENTVTDRFRHTYTASVSVPLESLTSSDPGESAART